jgi:DNA polymerase-3 subunit delta
VSVHLVKGNDPVLRDRVLDDLVDELLEGDDRAFALEEFTIPGRASGGDDSAPTGGAEAREEVVAGVVNAASSPPFMTRRRVVVVRDAGALTAADTQPLGRYLADPLDTTALVLVAGGGTLPAELVKQLRTCRADERALASEKTADVLAEALRTAKLRLRPDAVKRVSAHLGDDAGRVGAFVDVLAAAYPAGSQLGEDDVAPYLGEAGGIPTYQLTNAIEAGDGARALEVLNRLLTVSSSQQPKPMHPLQIMGTLTGYYRRVLRCDDPAVRTADDAVAALGGRVGAFPARKALEQARALGTDGIRRAFDHLHQADLDLKGARGIPEDAVMEVLVARLAQLGANGARTRRPARSRGGR